MEYLVTVAHTGHRHAQESTSVLPSPLLIALIIISLIILASAFVFKYKVYSKTRIKEQISKDSKDSIQ